MDTKELEVKVSESTIFVEKMKKWAVLDNHLKTIHEKTKIMRETRNQLERDVIEYLESHNLSNKKISINGGNLRIVERKEYSSLTYGYLEECLGELLQDKTQIQKVIEYMKDRRTVKIVKELA